MGVFGKSCYTNSSTVAAAPDPSKFEIIRIEETGRCCLVEVVYPGCTNFEGRKLLLIVGMTTNQILDLKILDPHFSNNMPILARFKPTRLGWDIARKLVDRLQESK